MVVLGLEGVAVVDDGADAVLTEAVIFGPELLVFGQDRGVFGRERSILAAQVRDEYERLVVSRGHSGSGFWPKKGVVWEQKNPGGGAI